MSFEEAKALQAEGRLLEAAQAYQALIEADGSDYRSLNNLGTVCEDLGDLNGAQTAYMKARALLPQSPLILYNLAHVLYRQNRFQAAIDMLGSVIELDPHNARAYYNLGNAHLELAQSDAAIRAFRTAIEIDPTLSMAYSNLAGALLDRGNLNDAQAMFETALALNETGFDHYNLGRLHETLERNDLAVKHYLRSIDIAPQSNLVRELLIHLLGRMGRLEESVEQLNAWLDKDPANAIARHLKLVYERNIPARASDEYVQSVFDGFAEHFETTLHDLAYRAPEIVAAEVESRIGEPAANLDVLDLGCGTGLCGPLLAAYARSLVGVDLSAGMLEQARKKNVYRDLVRCELTEFLGETKDRFGLVISCDTLNYLGDLQHAIQGISKCLQPGGWFVFTLEKGELNQPYTAGLQGRYQHSWSYVSSLLDEAGFAAVSGDEQILRKEAGVPVAGLIVSAQLA